MTDLPSVEDVESVARYSGDYYCAAMLRKFAAAIPELLALRAKVQTIEDETIQRCEKLADEFEYLDGSRATLVAKAIAALPRLAKEPK